MSNYPCYGQFDQGSLEACSTRLTRWNTIRTAISNAWTRSESGVPQDLFRNVPRAHRTKWPHTGFPSPTHNSLRLVSRLSHASHTKAREKQRKSDALALKSRGKGERLGAGLPKCSHRDPEETKENQEAQVKHETPACESVHQHQTPCRAARS